MSRLRSPETMASSSSSSSSSSPADLVAMAEDDGELEELLAAVQSEIVRRKKAKATAVAAEADAAAASSGSSGAAAAPQRAKFEKGKFYKCLRNGRWYKVISRINPDIYLAHEGVLERKKVETGQIREFGVVRSS